VQVPDSIPRPEYAASGEPINEMRSRAQNSGELRLSVELVPVHVLPDLQTKVLFLKPDVDLYLGAVPIYTPKQIAGIRKACLLARQILDKAHAAVWPGVTTDEIDKVVSVGRTSLYGQATVHLTTARHWAASVE
jgi:hypothetical protein